MAMAPAVLTSNEIPMVSKRLDVGRLAAICAIAFAAGVFAAAVWDSAASDPAAPLENVVATIGG